MRNGLSIVSPTQRTVPKLRSEGKLEMVKLPRGEEHMEAGNGEHAQGSHGHLNGHTTSFAKTNANKTLWTHNFKNFRESGNLSLAVGSFQARTRQLVAISRKLAEQLLEVEGDDWASTQPALPLTLRVGKVRYLASNK